jgi:hypothetical protein
MNQPMKDFMELEYLKMKKTLNKLISNKKTITITSGDGFGFDFIMIYSPIKLLFRK